MVALGHFEEIVFIFNYVLFRKKTKGKNFATKFKTMMKLLKRTLVMQFKLKKSQLKNKKSKAKEKMSQNNNKNNIKAKSIEIATRK